MNPFIYGLLVLLVVLAGVVTLFFRTENRNGVKVLLAFSGAYLLGIAFLHLLPEVYQDLEFNAGLYILGGFFIQVLLEYFSQGIEHGHIHASDKDKGRFPLAIYLSLVVHAFMEGMPIHTHHVGEVDHVHDQELLFGIILHKIPVAVVLVALMTNAGLTKGKVILWLIVFALAMPMGSLVNYWLESSVVENLSHYTSMILGLVLGILLHVSTTILFESSEGHRFTRIKLLAIMLGVGLAVVTLGGWS